MKKPKLEKLIQEIAMFDMAAACKLHKRKDNKDYEDKDNLRLVIDWDGTKEGFDYWSDINYRLESRRKNYHPHRDSMIEYANDKTIEIEFLKSDGSWEKCEGFPSFFEHDKYRKKPKVTKKAIEYRIYLDKENNIKTNYGKDQLPLNFEKWLGDWQKVEIEVEEND
jgi:hypothetical protein